jgi:pimeloyl-ACP methyl ester carboxylesterase
MAAAIPDVRLEVVEGAGHALVVERPEFFSALCLAFIRTVVQARSLTIENPCNP